jgi:CBS domain-containing protein
MRVSALMTRKPYTLQPEASLDEAMQLMDEHGLRHLPLVEGDRLVGIVSDRDLLEATGWMPARVREVYQDPVTDQRARTLQELAHRRVHTLHPDDTVVSAAIELVAGKIGCLPVLDHGALVGILTETDLVRAFADGCRGRVAGGERPAGELAHDARRADGDVERDARRGARAAPRPGRAALARRAGRTRRRHRLRPRPAARPRQQPRRRHAVDEVMSSTRSRRSSRRSRSPTRPT